MVSSPLDTLWVLLVSMGVMWFLKFTKLVEIVLVFFRKIRLALPDTCHKNAQHKLKTPSGLYLLHCNLFSTALLQTRCGQKGSIVDVLFILFFSFGRPFQSKSDDEAQNECKMFRFVLCQTFYKCTLFTSLKLIKKDQQVNRINYPTAGKGLASLPT